MGGMIVLGAPELVGDSAVRVEFDVSSNLRRYFVTRELTVTYDFPIGEVDPGVLMIPLLGNIATLAWVFDAEIRMPVCDETYLLSLERVRSAMQAIYPQLPLAGRISAESISNEPVPAATGAGLMFSGGVDSTASAVAHHDENLHLFTVIISDRHEDLPGNVHEVADALDAVHHTVDAPVLEGLLDRQQLSVPFKKHFLDWWSGIQHGLGLTALCAPATTALGLNPLYLASSYVAHDEGWGSHPSTDNEIRWAGAQVIHDLEHERRYDKVGRIVEFLRSRETELPLVVCDSSTNCGECEKCVRTMTGFLLHGQRPDAAGFPWESGGSASLRELTNRPNLISESSAVFWIEMRDSLATATPLDEPGVAAYVDHLRNLPIESMLAQYERRARVFRTLNRWTRMVPAPLHRRLYAVAKRLFGRWI